jgi:hypothetical protein
MRHSRVAILFGVAIIAAAGTVWGHVPPYQMPPGVLFVDAVYGSDHESCGTIPYDPCLTIQGAINTIPMVFDQDITVRIAPGTYEGGIVIAGRISPGMGKLTLLGEPGGVVITGPEGAQNGISILHSFNVVLENLRFEGFPGRGISIVDSIGNELRSVAVAGSRDGLFLGDSDTTIVGGSFENNRANGINCEGGWLTVGFERHTLLLVNNAASGLRADLCHATILAPVTVRGSSAGLLAMNAGEIDLNMRSDVRVTLKQGETGLVADHHGMISGYGNSCIGACTCTATGYGLCMTASSQGGGRNHRTVFDRNN